MRPQRSSWGSCVFFCVEATDHAGTLGMSAGGARRCPPQLLEENGLLVVFRYIVGTVVWCVSACDKPERYYNAICLQQGRDTGVRPYRLSGRPKRDWSCPCENRSSDHHLWQTYDTSIGKEAAAEVRRDCRISGQNLGSASTRPPNSRMGGAPVCAASGHPGGSSATGPPPRAKTAAPTATSGRHMIPPLANRWRLLSYGAVGASVISTQKALLAKRPHPLRKPSQGWLRV